jgi:hypothetical protein
MSKCEITIDFDRSDRIYLGGETVSGTVHILVNKDITSNGIKLTRFWRTHGRGNTDKGEVRQEMLAAESELRAGQTLDFPFSFQAECQPLTYHGHYVNIDHYVRVDVDVPWAIDPNAEEEFILCPGQRPSEISGRRDEAITFTSKSVKKASGLVKIILLLIVGVVLLVIASVAIILLPVILILGLIGFIWKKLIASRVGDVELNIAHLVVAPEEPLPLQIQFTPRKSFQINGVTAKLTGQETVSSGSGTDKTTYHHTIFEELYTLEPAGTISAGERFERRLSIDIPKTDAFSFDASDNDVHWSVEVRIDMPRFPDWKQKQDVQIVPAEFLDELTLKHDGGNSDAVASGESTPAATAASDSRSAAHAGPQPITESTAATEGLAANVPSGTSILPLVEHLLQADRYGNERKQLVERAADQTFDVSIDIERVVSTFGSTIDETHKSGKTIIGTISGTDQSAELFTLNDSQANDLRRDDRYETRVSISEWDSLYDRLVLWECQ